MGYDSITEVRAANEDGRLACPDCGVQREMDDNGSGGFNLAFCCTHCGTHVDAEEFLMLPSLLDVAAELPEKF